MENALRIELTPTFSFEVDQKLDAIDNQLQIIDDQIDNYTNHADKLDYTIAICSGIIAGIIDILFVGKLDLAANYEWSSEQINSFVIHIAKSQGFSGDNLDGAIRFLEKFGTPSDSVYSALGGARQHHLWDFAHHASPVGLAFSLLTQFTGNAYGTNTAGAFISVPITDTTFIGSNFSSKITFGLVYWVLHLASDMAGSSGTPGGGTGIPGPILSVVKLLSSSPLFNDREQVNKLSLNVSKLFNGTLLADRGPDGKMLRDAAGKPLIHKMDLRGELGLLHALGKQSLPIIVNEALVRGFYFVNRLVDELKTCQHIKDINWKHLSPTGNRTIERMILISTGTFIAVDTVDAAIEGAINCKGTWAEFARQAIIRLNFVGVGRFTVALGTDAIMGIKKHIKLKDRMILKNQILSLLQVKLYRGEVLLWTTVKEAHCSMSEFEQALTTALLQISSDAEDFQESISGIAQTDFTSLEGFNPGLTSEILSIL